MIRLAVFDLDGTLLDTRDDLGTATNHALKTLGFPEVELPRYNFLVGRGIMNLFRGALPEGHKTEENVLSMKKLFIEYYSEHSRDLTRPYEGIVAMLHMLKDNGVRIAIASNKYQKGTEELVQFYFPEIDFCRVLGQREGFPIKPDAEIIGEILRHTEMAKEDTVYIGDSDVDMMTGANAGVRTIGALWGFRTREELESYHPWHLSESPSELEEFLRSNL